MRGDDAEATVVLDPGKWRVQLRDAVAYREEAVADREEAVADREEAGMDSRSLPQGCRYPSTAPRLPLGPPSTASRLSHGGCPPVVVAAFPRPIVHITQQDSRSSCAVRTRRRRPACCRCGPGGCRRWRGSGRRLRAGTCETAPAGGG